MHTETRRKRFVCEQQHSLRLAAALLSILLSTAHLSVGSVCFCGAEGGARSSWTGYTQPSISFTMSVPAGVGRCRELQRPQGQRSANVLRCKQINAVTLRYRRAHSPCDRVPNAQDSFSFRRQRIVAQSGAGEITSTGGAVLSWFEGCRVLCWAVLEEVLFRRPESFVVAIAVSASSSHTALLCTQTCQQLQCVRVSVLRVSDGSWGCATERNSTR